MGLLARFFKGGLPISYMMTLSWRDLKQWYDIYLLQATEEEVISDLSYDSKGNKRTLPKPERIREIVMDRIREKKGENADEQSL